MYTMVLGDVALATPCKVTRWLSRVTAALHPCDSRGLIGTRCSRFTMRSSFGRARMLIGASEASGTSFQQPNPHRNSELGLCTKWVIISPCGCLH